MSMPRERSFEKRCYPFTAMPGTSETFRFVNICMPLRSAGWNADWKKFGFAGSIATEEACRQAGGRWVPQIFGWMVHVYPYEQDPAKVWAH